MRHSYFGKKLSRTKNERRRLFQSLARDLFQHGSIRTTLAKAKAVQPLVEKLITKAKRKGNSSTRQVSRVLADKQVVKKLVSDAQTRFANRTSGYTRIVKLGQRLGDATEEALLMLVDEGVAAEVVAPKLEKKAQAQKPNEKKPTKEAAKVRRVKAKR